MNRLQGFVQHGIRFRQQFLAFFGQFAHPAAENHGSDNDNWKSRQHDPGQFGRTPGEQGDAAEQDNDLADEFGQDEIKGVVQFFHIVGQARNQFADAAFFKKNDRQAEQLLVQRFPHIRGAFFADDGEHHDPQVRNHPLYDQDNNQPHPHLL